ncbi:hypothetical protein Pint_28432 [Pistacia integerrima]|uniref:Uncharacterized protein n=1 Tax=Pistacia integerrima TaxID=434235 RepID=A0ACC0YTS8_9ROSI|nr:hypothetical protein Pint_28432 [Pistacia integerrima]
MKRTKGCQDLHGMERDAQNTARQVTKEQNISGLSKGIDSQRLRSLGKMPPKHPFPSKVSCACEVFSEYNVDTLTEQRDILKEEMASLMITPSPNSFPWQSMYPDLPNHGCSYATPWSRRRSMDFFFDTSSTVGDAITKVS